MPDPRPDARPDALTLVADLGGSNCRLALARGGVLIENSIRRLSNAGFASPDALLRHYLNEQGDPRPQRAAIAIAAPVRKGRAAMTNTDWTLDPGTLRQVTGADHVHLLNDLQAQGCALDHLPPEALQPILPAPAGNQETRLVIGLGTGFNTCPVVRTDSGALALPAESGQCDLPLHTLDELPPALREHARPPRIEDLLSGPGLARAHAAIAGLSTPLPPAAVTRAAQAGDPDARETLRLFVRLLARVSANLALAHLPFGGIFLTGGVARAIGPFLGPMGYEMAFVARGNSGPLMRDFPVFLILDDFAALRGAATTI